MKKHDNVRVKDEYSFSSNLESGNIYSDKVQLLFVNSDEVYYFKGLSGLDIKMYLWLYLHEEHEMIFDCVYYLSFSQNQLVLSDFGDQLCDHFVRDGVVHKNLRKSASTDSGLVYNPTPKEFRSAIFPEWDKRCAAVVITIIELIEALRVDELNKAIVSFMKNRKGRAKLLILVTAEDSRLLRDNSIRQLLSNNLVGLIGRNIGPDEENVRDILYQNRDSADNCVFLDRLSYDDAKGIVCDVMMSRLEWIDYRDDLDDMTEYLRIVTDVDLPIDLQFGKSYKLLTRRECHEYISTDKGWNALVRNSKYLSRHFLMLDYLPDHFSDHINQITGNEISNDLEIYREHLQSNWDIHRDTCVYYSLLKLCSLLYSYRNVDATYTKDVIISALKELSRFSFVNRFSLSSKRKISVDILNGYMSCIEESKEISRERHNLTYTTRDPETAETIKSSVIRREQELKRSMEGLKKEVDNVFSRPLVKIQVEPDINDIDI